MHLFGKPMTLTVADATGAGREFAHCQGVQVLDTLAKRPKPTAGE
jgi:hypothetical protein